ncbi:MAG: dTDP-4-dehydrorhamnose 3,5-epimerase family protein [Planctomycetaceae bacterium]|nr:dTDP-4-dehydrorhamnose 3,5-epimerase family protein [Planctomycetaceae bacterium]
MSEFVEGTIHDVMIREIKRFTDSRGWLAELFRHDELPVDVHPAMCYVSETLPGIGRGPHEHADQTDLFAFLGPGDLKLYLWDVRKDSPTCGIQWAKVVGETYPCVVTVPPGVVHAYKCVSDKPALVFNAPNRLYAGEGKKETVDEIRYEEIRNSPFLLE